MHASYKLNALELLQSDARHSDKELRAASSEQRRRVADCWTAVTVPLCTHCTRPDSTAAQTLRNTRSTQVRHSSDDQQQTTQTATHNEKLGERESLGVSAEIETKRKVSIKIAAELEGLT